MTKEEAIDIVHFYQEAGVISELMPLLTALKGLGYYQEREGK